MNDLPTLHRPPRSLPCKPPKDIQLTLSLVGYALNSEDIESKVYTPMDVDDPTLYNPVNVDEPKVYTPMDVDETWVTAWNRSHEDTYCNGSIDSSMEGSPQVAITSDPNCASTYPGMFARLDCAPGLTDCQMKNLLSTSNQNFLPPSNSGQHLVQREWESWDSGTLADQKLMYRKKWEIMKRNKQPLFPFQFRHIPWPIFRSGEKYPEINTPSVEYFIFGETRGKPPTKESKRLVKENLKLFHSDKFALVLGRVLPVDREWARYCAEALPALDSEVTDNIYVPVICSPDIL
ncbi:hypothetical protein B0H14DRAFT_3133291 [Mycena olivaceomarginata]|nr:hypothetical protein B0H14DRAFT_3133291 [Mycena olivaceomarginata]